MDKGEEKRREGKEEEEEEERRKRKEDQRYGSLVFFVWMLWILYGFMILYGKIKP